MERPCAVICPADWSGALGNDSSTGVLIKPIPRPDLHTLGSATQGTAQLLRELGLLDGVDTAVLVLPLQYAQSGYSTLWPQPVLQWVEDGEGGTTRMVILSTVFADCPTACLEALALRPSEGGLSRWNVTAQYAPAYIDTLLAWQAAGANSFHPGDYFKADLIKAMGHWSGHWVYVGHAEVDRLRGYQHVLASDLRGISKRDLLDSTWWLSCNTLAHKAGVQPLGLTWYLSGATRLFLGAVAPTDTLQNQHFCKLFLHAILQMKASNNAHTLAEVLRRIFSNTEWSSAEMECVNSHPFNLNYRLLGNPWVVV